MPASVTTLEALLATPSASDFKASMLSVLESLGFPVTSWEIDGVAYQIVSCLADNMATLSLVQRGITSGGFLDLAAAMKNEDGTDAFPWLDLLSTYLYRCPRIEAGFASGDYTISNGNGFPIILSAGDIRCVNADGYSYTSITGGTVPASGSLVVTITADQPGATGTAAGGTITVQNGPSGITGTNAAPLVGTAAETNVALASRCRAKLSSLSPNGAAAAYAYFAPMATTVGGTSLGVTRVGLSVGHYEYPVIPTPPYPGQIYLYAATASGPLGGSSSPPATYGACYDLWAYLMQWCVPDAVRLRVLPAELVSIPITATIYLRATGLVSADDVYEAVASYLATVPIGGVQVGGQGIVPYSALIDTIHNVSSTIKSVDLTSPASNVVLGASAVPVLDQAGSSLTFVVLQ